MRRMLCARLGERAQAGAGAGGGVQHWIAAPQVERLGQAAASPGAEKRLNCARIRRIRNPEHVPNGLELA